MRFKSFATNERRKLFEASCSFEDPRTCGLHYAKAYGRKTPGGPAGFVTAAVVSMEGRRKAAPADRSATPRQPPPSTDAQDDPIARAWDHAQGWVRN